MAATTVSSANCPINPPIKTYSTQDYLQVLQEADTRSTPQNGVLGNPFYSGPDGQVDKQELTTYNQQIHQNLQFFNMIGQFFGQSMPQFNDFLKPFGDDLQKKADISNIMLNNFGEFYSASGMVGPFPANATINQQDIQAVAARDGNPQDVTATDIQQQGITSSSSGTPSLNDLLNGIKNYIQSNLSSMFQ